MELWFPFDIKFPMFRLVNSQTCYVKMEGAICRKRIRGRLSSSLQCAADARFARRIAVSHLRTSLFRINSLHEKTHGHQ